MKKFIALFILLMIIIPANVFAVEVLCPTAILIEMETGKILYEKEAYKSVYPASTTKILTAILALENCKLDDEVTASYNAIMSVPWDGTTAAIQVGETWKVSQLIDAMMVCSANESANMLAEHIGGSVESFASMMNARAKEIGAKNTHFVNANGLHDKNHTTTVYDMAVIARYAMENFEYFRRSAKLEKFSLPTTSIYGSGDRNYINTNRMIIPSSSYYYEHCTGIKTGYTSKAFNCIVASAEKDGVELIAVVFGAQGAENRTKDIKTLFEFGFEKLKSETFMPAGTIVKTLEIPGAPGGENVLNVTLAETVAHTIDASKETFDYEPQIEINPDLKAPINSGDVVGTIKYDIDGNVYTYDLLASANVESLVENIKNVAAGTAKLVGKVIFWAVMSVIGFIIGLIFLRAAIITKRNRSRRRRRAIYNARFR